MRECPATCKPAGLQHRPLIHIARSTRRVIYWVVPIRYLGEMTEMGCSTDEEEEEVAQACATVERHKGKKRKRAQQRQRLQIKVFAPLEHLTREGLYHLLAQTVGGGRWRARVLTSR